MLKNLTFSFVGVAALAAAATPLALADAATPATTAASVPFTQDNPFAKPSSLPLQAPDFGKIKESDYKPALEEGMKQQAAEIAKIADNPDAPSFDNTIAAIEKSGQLLARTERVVRAVVLE